MIHWLFLILAVFVGYVLCGLLSGNATEEAYREGQEECARDIEYLNARNIELTKKCEVLRNIK
jgi:hypothetical protein